MQLLVEFKGKVL